MAAADALEAVVLRTIRYGEADLIAHVHTRTGGVRGAIAKGARRPKSRLGARLEPFLVVRLQLIEGRGDLATVRGVEVIAAHEQLRSSWRAQQAGAAAFELVRRLSVEHEPNEPMHHLVRNFLDVLDAAAGDPATEEVRAATTLAAFELKLLHVAGIAPQLAACVRCGDRTAVVGYAAQDGGVTCVSCRVPTDTHLDERTHVAAVELMRAPMVAALSRPVADLPDLRTLRSIGVDLVRPTCVAHAGFGAGS